MVPGLLPFAAYLYYHPLPLPYRTGYLFIVLPFWFFASTACVEAAAFCFWFIVLIAVVWFFLCAVLITCRWKSERCIYHHRLPLPTPLVNGTRIAYDFTTPPYHHHHTHIPTKPTPSHHGSPVICPLLPPFTTFATVPHLFSLPFTYPPHIYGLLPYTCMPYMPLLGHCMVVGNWMGVALFYLYLDLCCLPTVTFYLPITHARFSYPHPFTLPYYLWVLDLGLPCATPLWFVVVWIDCCCLLLYPLVG